MYKAASDKVDLTEFNPYSASASSNLIGRRNKEELIKRFAQIKTLIINTKQIPELQATLLSPANQLTTLMLKAISHREEAGAVREASKILGDMLVSENCKLESLFLRLPIRFIQPYTDYTQALMPLINALADPRCRLKKLHIVINTLNIKQLMYSICNHNDSSLTNLTLYIETFDEKDLACVNKFLQKHGLSKITRLSLRCPPISDDKFIDYASSLARSLWRSQQIWGIDRSDLGWDFRGDHYRQSAERNWTAEWNWEKFLKTSTAEEVCSILVLSWGVNTEVFNQIVTALYQYPRYPEKLKEFLEHPEVNQTINYLRENYTDIAIDPELEINVLHQLAAVVEKAQSNSTEQSTHAFYSGSQSSGGATAASSSQSLESLTAPK